MSASAVLLFPSSIALVTKLLKIYKQAVTCLCWWLYCVFLLPFFFFYSFLKAAGIHEIIWYC